jgi:hypothetical protein
MKITNEANKIEDNLESEKKREQIIVQSSNINSIKSNSDGNLINIETTNCLNEHILTLIKLVENTNKLMKKEKKYLNTADLNSIEWKEAARRMDSILYLVSVSIVTITPIYLFSGYFFGEYKSTFSEKCGCSLH